MHCALSENMESHAQDGDQVLSKLEITGQKLANDHSFKRAGHSPDHWLKGSSHLVTENHKSNNREQICDISPAVLSHDSSKEQLTSNDVTSRTPDSLAETPTENDSNSPTKLPAQSNGPLSARHFEMELEGSFDSMVTVIDGVSALPLSSSPSSSSEDLSSSLPDIRLTACRVSNDVSHVTADADCVSEEVELSDGHESETVTSTVSRNDSYCSDIVVDAGSKTCSVSLTNHDTEISGDRSEEELETDNNLSKPTKDPDTGDRNLTNSSLSERGKICNSSLRKNNVEIEPRSLSADLGDQLVESILIDEEDIDRSILRKKKEVRPNSIRLSLGVGGGIGGAGTPTGRMSNFGNIADDINLDETQFEEINLQSCNLDHRTSVSDRASSSADSNSSGATSKTSRLGSFLFRNFSLKKSQDGEQPSNDVLGWKLFGRVPQRPPVQSSLPEVLSEYRAELSSNPTQPPEKDTVRRSDKEVPSTTALILQARPSGLPTKDPEEELKHKLMYDEMVEAARKSEQKEAKLRKKQREQQIRHEEELSAAVRVWNTEILPFWETVKNSKKTQDLWWKGIPPSVRGKVWKLAIGNDLNVTSELYEICVVRAREKLKILRDVAGSDTDSLSSFTSEAAGNRESSVDLIQLDVSRTFPQLCIFQASGPYHDLLQGLLGAYVCYRPDVGYVQGMSFLAAVLLLNMDDVSSFVCFANLLNKPCTVAFFRLDENLMKAYFDTYQEFFKENLQKLYAHFEAQHITPDLYIIDWMYTLYAKSLPLDVASRVWDVFCRDGEEFLFRTALGILRLYEDILLNLDFIHLAQFLTRLPENISGAELFHCIGQIRMQLNKCSFAQVLARNQCPS